MNQLEFDATVQARKSSDYFVEKVGRIILLDALTDAMQAIERLDRIKSALFYGKDDPSLTIVSGGTTLFNHETLNPDLVHGVLGLVTESSELLHRLIIMGVRDPEPEDKINIIEELGDLEWFMSLTRKSLGLERDLILLANDLKLTTRYGPAFKQQAAVERNLSAEQEALRDATQGSSSE
jgi:hypothetical protein